MACGKGTRGRGGRGGSNARNTRANPDLGDLLEVGVHERDLALGKRSQDSAGATGGDDTLTKKKKQNDEEEDWGLEGKSFWKSRVPQSVDSICFVMNQLPPK